MWPGPSRFSRKSALAEVCGTWPRGWGSRHQNLFRYFPTKEALIERVYREVYLNRWQPEWEVLLNDKTDRCKPG